MKKEEVRMEIEAALEKFKESGGLVEILPDGAENKVFGWEDETVHASTNYGEVRALNLDAGIEHLRTLKDFFALDVLTEQVLWNRK